MRYITVDKNFFKNLEFRVHVPTFKCKVCDKQILDCPSNWHLKDSHK